MTKVPLLDLKQQYASLRADILESIVRVCDSQQFILGPEVSALEESIAEFCGARFAVGMSSGTDALLATLMAIGIRSGDEVITSCYSFFATAGVIARLGARPVFVDIDPVSFNLDPLGLEAKLTSRTKLIVPVHLFGRVADMNSILSLADNHGIPVIEDAAQAIGAHDEQGRRAGTIGLAGSFSFFPSKNLGAFGDGGMTVTSSEEHANALRMIRAHGSKPKYHHPMIGGNFRLDAIQAAVLRVKLRHLPIWTERRRHNAVRYRLLFEKAGLTETVGLPKDTPGHIYNQFVVRFAERDRLRQFLKEKGVETEIYYPVPLHLLECFRNLGYRLDDFPHAEAASRDTLALPIYPELTEDQQRHVVESIREFVSCSSGVKP